MKIRAKVILVELGLSTVLFSAILLALSVLVNYIQYSEFQLKFTSLKKDLERNRYILLSIPYTNAPAKFQCSSYELSYTQLKESFEEIRQNRFFQLLPQDVQDRYTEITQLFEKNSQSLLTENTLQGFLNLRAVDSSGQPVSLYDTRKKYLENKEESSTGFKNVEQALNTIQRYEYNLNSYDYHLGRNLVQINSFGKIYRRTRIYQSMIPALSLILLSLAGMFFFGNWISSNLKRMSDTLTNIARGDFSLRIQTRSRDEFRTLADSINTFTQALDSKLESFRRIMTEIGQTLTSSLDSSQVEETFIQLAISDTAADGAAIYKVLGDNGEMVATTLAGRFRPPFTLPDLPENPEEDDIVALVRSRIIQPGKTIIGESAASGQSILLQDVNQAEDQDWIQPPDHPLYLSSLIAIPLQVSTTIFGVLVVTSSRTDQLFSDLDFINMQSFGELASITLDNIYKYSDLLEAAQLNREIGIAEEIQQDLIPSRIPRIPCGKVAFYSKGIKGLNGDYFDVHPLSNGQTMMVICEVAGRGIPAGLIMVMIRTILRLVAPQCRNAGEVLNRLNQSMTQRIEIENFASAGILVFDNRGSFSYASAAHHPLQILRRAQEEYEALEMTGLPVGVDVKTTYNQIEGTFRKGDIILLHSDGIPEARNRDGQMFGMQALLDLIKNQENREPQAIVSAISQELVFWKRGTEQTDDETAIILEFTGEKTV